MYLQHQKIMEILEENLGSNQSHPGRDLQDPTGWTSSAIFTYICMEERMDEH